MSHSAISISHERIPITLNIGTIKTVGKELMLLLDTTGSMTEPAALGSHTLRYQVIGEALDAIVTRLSAEDSQGAHEDGGGGIYTVTFAGGTADDFGDVNPHNLQHFWDTRQWRGSTSIMPGYLALRAHYKAEFLDNPEETNPPLLCMIVLTDGELKDEPTFEQALQQDAASEFVVIGVVGHGSEHDAALAAYQRLAQQYPNVAVMSFGGVTNGDTVAKTLLDLIM